MTTPASTTATATHVRVSDRALTVELEDGRVVSVPIDWYPRLAEASSRERRSWVLVGSGVGIHWPALDEDVSVDGLLRGLSSGESAASLDRWRATRRRRQLRAPRKATPRKAAPAARSGARN